MTTSSRAKADREGNQHAEINLRRRAPCSASRFQFDGLIRTLGSDILTAPTIRKCCTRPAENLTCGHGERPSKRVQSGSDMTARERMRETIGTATEAAA